MFQVAHFGGFLNECFFEVPLSRHEVGIRVGIRSYSRKRDRSVRRASASTNTK